MRWRRAYDFPVCFCVLLTALIVTNAALYPLVLQEFRDLRSQFDRLEDRLDALGGAQAATGNTSSPIINIV